MQIARLTVSQQMLNIKQHMRPVPRSVTIILGRTMTNAQTNRCSHVLRDIIMTLKRIAQTVSSLAGGITVQKIPRRVVCALDLVQIQKLPRMMKILTVSRYVNVATPQKKLFMVICVPDVHTNQMRHLI